MPPSIEIVEEYVRRNFLVADEGIIRLLCATIIANRLPGDPVWLLVVAPPSGLKTELLNALDDVSDIYHLSALTPQTLISGQKRPGHETSLLVKLNGKILTFKDFTTILEMNFSARDEILSQLREVYDGKYSKGFGTGDEIKWEGKVGFMAGVTDAIELHQGRISVLGERFIQYRMKQPDREAAAEMGLENSEHIVSIRSEMKRIFPDYIDSIKIPDDAPPVTRELKREIIELSNFGTLARTGIVRDSKDREISYAFPPEMPVRFAKQLIQICKAFMLMGGFGDKEHAIIRKIAISSVPRNKRNALLILLKKRQEVVANSQETLIAEDEEADDGGETEWTTRSIAIMLDLPTTTTRRIMEELNALGLIQRRGKGQGTKMTWDLKPKYRDLLMKYYAEYGLE